MPFCVKDLSSAHCANCGVGTYPHRRQGMTVLRYHFALNLKFRYDSGSCGPVSWGHWSLWLCGRWGHSWSLGVEAQESPTRWNDPVPDQWHVLRKLCGPGSPGPQNYCWSCEVAAPRAAEGALVPGRYLGDIHRHPRTRPRKNVVPSGRACHLRVSEPCPHQTPVEGVQGLYGCPVFWPVPGPLQSPAYHLSSAHLDTHPTHLGLPSSISPSPGGPEVLALQTWSMVTSA